MEMTKTTQARMADISTPVSADNFDSHSLVESEAEQLREELQAERDQRLRLAAEYKNYRRRTEQESAQAADKGKRELLLQIVSLVDDLELALAGLAQSPDSVAEGLRIIDRRFRGILEANNVLAFESENERFDPERHEAFDVVTTGDRDPGTVYREMRRGYFWNDRLLRPALVVVEQ
jgi:molecular chaperone GrpE